MCEKRILIASLLKPVNDTRLFEKLGLSLAKLPEVDVHIAAFEAPLPADAPTNLHFHPVFRFRRISFGRLQAQHHFFRLLLQLRPDVLVISTHELLFASSLYKLFSSCRLVYDIQENYALNLQAQHHYPWLLKHLFAGLVRATEKLVSPLINHFLVAEQSYLQELPFLKQRATLIANKYKPDPGYRKPPFPVQLKGQPLKLLYSGTISDVYGIFEAIRFADKLHALFPDTTLTIIGYCAHSATLEKLRAEISTKPFILLIGGDNLVPHQQIIDQINKCNVGLLPYQPNASTFRCIPTKLYEYMGQALPLLIQDNPVWKILVEQAQAGFAIDFKSPDVQHLRQALLHSVFYSSGVPASVFWENEEPKLLEVFQKIL